MQTLGDLLRALRQKQRLSQEQVAIKAQVTARALRYWEANQQQPRDVELESLLKALKATPQERTQIYAQLSEPRRIRLMQSVENMENVSSRLLGPLPGIGDLIRALRIRRGWTQEPFARAMGISRATVIRWEATRTLPSEEDIQRLTLLLRAAPEECAALYARRLSPTSWNTQLTLEECREQAELLAQVRSGENALLPLADLYNLALKRQVRSLLGQSQEAMRLLARIEVHHGWWLFMQGRAAEACAGNWRALHLMRDVSSPDMFWMGALNILAANAASGPRGPESGIQLLAPYLHQFPAAFHPYLLCDMALYAGRAQQNEEARHLLERARRTLPEPEKARLQAPWYAHWYLRMTSARVLLSLGKPLEALSGLPELPLRGDSRINELLVWAETSLAAGEKNMASRYLSEAQEVLLKMPLPQRQSKLEQLAQQL